jgi:hypothetical protein
MLLTVSRPVVILLAVLVVWPSVLAQPPEDAAAASATTPGDAGPPLETDPAVLAALELPREAPADYFQAIVWLIELDRPELAKPILDELVQLQINDAQRAALVEEFGSRSMLILARAKELGPAAAEFADVCMAAAANAASDPQRISALVQQLVDPSAERRQLAINDLAAAGKHGVTATLEALAHQSDPNRRAALAKAAVKMEPLVSGPLLAMLSTEDPTLRADVSRLLQQLGVMQAAPFLATSRASAERALSEAIDDYLAGTPVFAPDESNQVELWHWNDATKKLVAARYPAADAQVIWTARLARQRALVRPTDRAYQRQAWLLGGEAAGLIGTSAEIFSAVDTTLIVEVLADALQRNYAHAAVAAANELGRRRDVGVLHTVDGHPSPLADALAHPHRRVRFAALAAVMAMDPNSPYPGSSRVPKALSWFAGSTGERQAVVAMPTNAAATDLAGMLAEHDLDAQATNRGRDAVDMAREIADLEMILVDVDILQPGIRQVLYELRTIETTGHVPIALLAGDGQLEAAEELAGEHDRMIAVPRLHSKEVVARTVAELSVLAGGDWTSAEERAAQALQAIHWIESLLSNDRRFYELEYAMPAIEASLYRSDATEPSFTFFARLGTPESQRTLVNFASQTSLPAALRLRAAAAFRTSVAKNGLLLTTDEILAQYERYNASAGADAETQRILGALLDTIESRRGAAPPAAAPAP